MSSSIWSSRRSARSARYGFRFHGRSPGSRIRPKSRLPSRMGQWTKKLRLRLQLRGQRRTGDHSPTGFPIIPSRGPWTRPRMVKTPLRVNDIRISLYLFQQQLCAGASVQRNRAVEDALIARRLFRMQDGYEVHQHHVRAHASQFIELHAAIGAFQGIRNPDLAGLCRGKRG